MSHSSLVTRVERPNISEGQVFVQGLLALLLWSSSLVLLFKPREAFSSSSRICFYFLSVPDMRCFILLCTLSIVFSLFSFGSSPSFSFRFFSLSLRLSFVSFPLCTYVPSMNVGAFICTHVCMHVCIHVCMYAFTRVCMYEVGRNNRGYHPAGWLRYTICMYEVDRYDGAYDAASIIQHTIQHPSSSINAAIGKRNP